MVDFNKKIINSSKFQQAAIFFKEHGTYTLAPRGTTDYIQYWDQETKRCLNGYVAPDGDAITGYHYFYLNYCPIMKLEEVEYIDRYGNKRKRRERIFGFPRFWDYDYYYFNAIEQAEDEGKHMAVLKSRQRGYSFKGAAMLVRNYELIPGSKNFAVASEQKFLVGDGLLTKAWQIMDFIDKNTAWSKQRLTSTRMERVSGFKIKDEFGKETEQGYLSSITGVTLKNDPERIRGTRGKLVLWEEGGKFPNLLTAWRVEQPAVETDDGRAFGLMIAFGTGGTEGGQFDGLKDLFYQPDAYNVLSFDNIWDDGREQTKCGFFVPSWSNMEGEDKDGQPLMDDDGNSLKQRAVDELLYQRNKIKDGGATQQSIDRFISERPLKPQEAVLELGKNIFPRKMLMDQLTRIRTNTKLANMKHIVDLSWDGNGQVTATEKKSGDITTYHLKKDDKPEGSVVIWEYPIKDPPFGLYIGGCLTPGEKVQTQRGLVNVEEVGLGDRLVNRSGELVEIRNLQRYEKENEPIYKLKPAGSYRTTTFTGEHPIYLKDKGFVKMKDVKRGDWLSIPNRYRPYYPENKFKNGLDEILWKWPRGYWDNGSEATTMFFYFLGLFVGDGFTNINGNSYDVYMSIGKQESEFAEYYDTLVEKIFERKCIKVRGDREQTRRFTDKELVEFLNKEFGHTAYKKRVPDWIKEAVPSLKRAFIQGYLDTDGSVFYDRGKIRANFTSVNLELLEDIQDILYGLEIRNSIVGHQKPTKNSLQSYRINVALCDNLKLAEDPIYESRKQKILKMSASADSSRSKIQFDGNRIYIKIDDIEESLYTGTVYNFECDTHTYMCRNILTHNCDPYDHDESFTNSLGSTFIFKRVKAGEAWNDVIVAEYSGRPATAEEYYENVRKLLMFYNARLLFENERKGIYPYFTNKHCDYLLADQPDKIITEIFKDSKVQRRKGCHMTKAIRAYGEGLILEWLLEEYEPGHPNLERIYSEPLIEELIENDGVKNVDRLIAMCMVMIYREELYQVKVQAHKEQNKQIELFETPLFGSHYWDDVGVQETDPIFQF